MAVAFRASATGSANPTTGFTFTVPATTQADDVVYLWITNRDSTSAPGVVDNEGAGAWAMKKNQAAATNGGGSLWWKRATANTNSKTITVSGLTGSSAGVLLVFSGVPTSWTEPIADLWSESRASGTERTTRGISMLADRGGAAVLCVANTANDNAVSGGAFDNELTTDGSIEHLSTGGSDCGAYMSYCLVTNASTAGYGRGTWTQVNGTTAALIFEIPGMDLSALTDKISLVGHNCPAIQTPTTAADVHLPSWLLANDVIFAWITNRDATGDPTVGDDEGAGSWAKVTNQAAATSGSGSIWWKRASANTHDKLLSISGVTGSIAVVIRVYRGAVTTGDPYEQVAGEANASGNETQVQITPTGNDRRVCFAVFNKADITPTTMVCTDPTLVSQTHYRSTGGSDSAVDVVCGQQGTAAPTGAFTWAQSNGTTASVAFAIIPASAGVSAAPGVGSLTLTGQAPTIFGTKVAAPGAGALSLTGLAPAARLHIRVKPGVGSLSLNGLAPAAKLNIIPKPGAGALSLTGFEPTIDIAAAPEDDITVSVPPANKHPLLGWQMSATGDKWMSRGAALTISDTKVGTMNVLLKLAAGSDGLVMPILSPIVGGSAYPILTRNASNTLIFTLRRNDLGVIWQHELTNFDETNYPGWVNIIISWDLAATTGLFYVDGAPAGTSTTGPLDNTVELDGFNGSWDIGLDFIDNDFLEADMARIFFTSAAFIDLTDATNREKFHAGAAMNVDGSRPLGIQPEIFFQLSQWSAGRRDLRNRGSGGSFSVPGTFAFSADNPTDGLDDLGLTLSGFSPAVVNPKFALPGAGALTLTGLAPAPRLNVRAKPDVGALTLDGQAPIILTPRTVPVGAGALTLTGQAPTIGVAAVTFPPAGQLLLTGFKPQAVAAQLVVPGLGFLTLTGFNPLTLLAPFYQDSAPTTTEFYTDSAPTTSSFYTDSQPVANDFYVDKTNMPGASYTDSAPTATGAYEDF